MPGRLHRIPVPRRHVPPPLRGWLTLAIGLGIIACLASIWFVATAVRSEERSSGSALIFATSVLLTAVRWGFGIAGWIEEFRANTELPIINLGILLVPAGVLLGVAGVAAAWAQSRSQDGRRSH
ncbi:hypothetical protein C3B44_03035 [Corynebacterium yudongzhengii]|uniref:Uncharacterized protein n=1 Tax=Corynebacterium yudongzhengii TaxID=2080740 RepID=A0A2U1T4B3_9CORY|nr:hypothetical protein C3B44_03035 [Corynebacterium yudongzhengii]PWC00837.1 hypothetical protein DF222_10690 [Corynebacterium yudongzhengii]